MREFLNTLYVQTQGAVLHVEHDTVRVTVDKETKLRLPLLRLSGIVVFGRVTVTPFMIQRCAEDGRSLVWLTRTGRFRARVEGPARGNVLLRRAQHLVLSDGKRTLRIARQIIAAKLQNSRQILLRSAREASGEDSRTALGAAAAQIATSITQLPTCRTLDEARGVEGDAARTYFSVFGHHMRVEPERFAMEGRTRRPPRDRVNALISFLYALLRAECAAGLESVGLDPQVGFLHALRPGRPALALDLMEEFRPVLADRLAISLINRRQVQADHFDHLPGGAVNLNDEGRRQVLQAYQKRKEEEVQHRVIDQKVPLGLLPYIQARLLARHLRGDLEAYPPYLVR
ncbi:type I-C CRISPR-associated endonuclease Cas1c [Oscillochloris sp. ZM17-4]|uniref:type I-C CRISPR-associated endonuclease Cas1c n=1 Tax=Oscillochloris sp. ZM17-4 TaxID=2866714 RepID=UPI001C733486|nr:type I-C CRISPR-associated endonuclease Cas1c [Oscillochloris sp. ZM17-4]MBX0330210.1 type I-C CRISPR-associated endonuclease Cas1c [Oscillochloris sp. ZM17-4]